ncbi:MAG TPA: hypothetical protein ENK34_12665 [Rhodobacteraceae bacterium]|nr:hypothetical protein [Paracoccaceae bacterium]
MPDTDTPVPDAALPRFTTRRDAEDADLPDTAIERIEKTETRLAILPEGKTSKSPLLGGVKRKETKAATTSAPAAPLRLENAISPLLDSKNTDEEQAMTVFGARKVTTEKGKPRYLGLALMGLLVIGLAAVALWASFLPGKETAADGDVPVVADAPAEEIPVVAEAAPEPPTPEQDPVGDALAMLTEPTIRRDPVVPAEPEQIAELPPLTGADTAPLPTPATPSEPEQAAATEPEQEQPVAALPEPAPEPEPEQVEEPEPVPTVTAENAQETYEESGFWQLPPPASAAPAGQTGDTLYIASVDPQITSHDAVALPAISLSPDTRVTPPQNPPIANSESFHLDDRGLVIPSVEGTLNPDGILVFKGPPPVKPAVRGNRAPDVTPVSDDRLAGFKPAPRPANLVQANETAQLGGRTRSELAGFRPKPRPFSAKVEEELDETPTENAVVLSRLPNHRPRNFARLVARARASAPSEQATAAAAVPRNQTVTPPGPTRGSVARLATTKNAINLRRTSLIGVYGSPGNRRALVRLANGRYVKVKVGQRVDGGKVAAIGESELRYVKGGRTVILRMPKL